MKRVTVLLFLYIISFALVSSANAGIWESSVTFSDLNDQRTFSSTHYDPPSSQGGLSGYWPFSFTIEWDVTQDASTMLWTYEYTLSATRKDISHFILELTEGTTQNDLMNLSINGKPATFGNEIEGPNSWGQHPSNPGYPTITDIYGIKFDVGGNPITYSFTTDLDPVWGNFYAKGGKHEGEWVYAYNNALELESFNSDNPNDFIVRPDGGSTPPIVPEPVSSLLFITGGVTLGFKFYCKRRKKHSV